MKRKRIKSVLFFLAALVVAWSSAFAEYDKDVYYTLPPGFMTRLNLMEAQVRELSEEPSMIRLSFAGSSMTQMTVTWSTESSDNPNQVKYGRTPSYELGTVTGTGYESPFSGYIHTATLTGLIPGSLYHYSVSGDGGTVWSQDATFRAAPWSWSEIRFYACGDSRQWLPWPLGNLDGWNAITDKMAFDIPAFVVFSGDMTYDGVTQPYWHDWFDKCENITSRCPVMPCIGNHETVSDDPAEHYLGMFTLPEGSGTERWYSFDYANIHVICLDTQRTSDPAQIAWLESDLAAASESAEWIIANFHKPPYTSGWGTGFHSPSGSVQAYFVPLFDQYHVDLAFSGHNHFYERTYPLYGGDNPSDPTVTDWDPCEYTDPEGTIYVVTGASGAPTVGYYTDNSAGYVANHRALWNHFLEISVGSDNVLHCNAVGADDDYFDPFWIIKTQQSPTPAPTPQPIPASRPKGTLLLAAVFGLLIILFARKKLNA